jgi:uncharacterized protein YdaU (DUF1376 family)
VTDKKSDTWMPFYVGDYLRATNRLTAEQHGAYLLLILDQWTNGPLPNNDGVLAQIARMTPAAWRKAKPALIGYFKVKDGQLVQKRVEQERERASTITEKRSQSGKAGAAGKWGEAVGKNGRALRSERMAEARRKGTHTAEEWASLVAFCGGSCVRCGSDERIVKDHITPIYQGGSDAIDNLQPLCGRCNSSKGPDATDLRPSGWQNALRTPDKCLTTAAENASQAPAPSQPPSSKPPKSSLTALRATDCFNEVCIAADWRAANDTQRQNGISIIAGWLALGCTLELILDGIARARKRDPSPTRTLKRFDSTIRGMRRDQLGGELPVTGAEVDALRAGAAKRLATG